MPKQKPFLPVDNKPKKKKKLPLEGHWPTEEEIKAIEFSRSGDPKVITPRELKENRKRNKKFTI